MNIECDADGRDALYQDLLAQAHGLPNSEILACMFATWVCGGGVLPDGLGLMPAQFQRLRTHYFPHASAVYRGDLDPARAEERGEIRDLLAHHRAGRHESESWLAAIVAAACMGGDHLWQDLGLGLRHQLSELMQYNFPSLAVRNTKDMKWKRFLYKQLCTIEGIHACRSPSCEICIDYVVCFGSEI